jgi:hypothetical protein
MTRACWGHSTVDRDAGYGWRVGGGGVKGHDSDSFI